jgi:hypothetical protein
VADADFERLNQASRALYGPPGLLASGFPATAQPKLKALLSRAGLSEVPVVWVARRMAHRIVADLLAQPDGTGAGADSDLPRALVVSGIVQGDLHRLMAAARQSGMRNAIWATVTPTSEQWPFSGLLEALTAERIALASRSESPAPGS